VPLPPSSFLIFTSDFPPFFCLSSRPHFLIHNSYFILSSLSAIFRAFMQFPKELAREKINNRI
jgi:hypothetical protein